MAITTIFDRHRSHLTIPGAAQPPQGSEPTGEMIRWGREMKPVYRLDMRRYGDTYLPFFTEQVPLVIDGKTQMKYVGGQPVAAKTHRVVKKEFEENPELYFREFILVNGGNGMERMEFNFRASPEDNLRAEQEKLNEPAFLAARLEALESRAAADKAELTERLDRAARLLKEEMGLSLEDADALLSGDAEMEP